MTDWCFFVITFSVKCINVRGKHPAKLHRYEQNSSSSRQYALPATFRRRALAAGCTEYLLKSLDFDRLDKVLSDFS